MRSRILAVIPYVVFFISLTGLECVSSITVEKSESIAEVVSVIEQTNLTVQITEEAIEVDSTGILESEPEEIPEPFYITAVGDIMLGRGVGMRLEAQNKGYLYPFEKVEKILKKGDVVFGNLEAPITDSQHSLDKNGKFVLRMKPEAINGIVFAGFNLLSLANNHIMDYYDRGLFDTMNILDEHDINCAGAGMSIEDAVKATVINIKDMKVGMLSYTDMADLVFRGNPSISFSAGEDKPGVAPNKFDYIKENIESIRKEVDILIVSLHWGIEESFRILPEQVEYAHAIIDMGADLILGHHTHQFQGIEIYKGKPIAYSLGNFIFDQNDPENQESFILTIEFTDSVLTGLWAEPVRTIGKTQVVPIKGEDAEKLLKREMGLCAKLNTTCIIEDDKLVFEINN